MYRYEKMIPAETGFDVIVCGGGCAGIAAAVAAAENGASTLLLERSGCVGGTATNGLVAPFMSSYSGDGKEQLVRGVFERLVRRMEKMGGAVHPSNTGEGTRLDASYILGHSHTTPFDANCLRIAAMELLKEAGAEVRILSQVVDVCMEDSRVTGIIADSPAGLRQIPAKIVIDCTGDGTVAVKAGAEFDYGRHSDGLPQPMSLFFSVENVDEDAVDRYLREHPEEKGRMFGSIIASVERDSGYRLPRDRVNMYKLLEKGTYMVNVTRVSGRNGLDPTALAAAELETRRQILEILDFLKRYLPGCARVKLRDAAAEIGRRETRRILGEYVLTKENLTNPENFEDTIARFGYPMDIHAPAGAGGGPVMDRNVANFYYLPYRMLLPRGSEGLLVAGRCVSATHEALAAVRVMPACFATGEAAGTAAALAVRSGCPVREVDLQQLRQKLKESGNI